MKHLLSIIIVAMIGANCLTAQSFSVSSLTVSMGQVQIGTTRYKDLVVENQTAAPMLDLHASLLGQAAGLSIIDENGMPVTSFSVISKRTLRVVAAPTMESNYNTAANALDDIEGILTISSSDEEQVILIKGDVCDVATTSASSMPPSLPSLTIEVPYPETHTLEQGFQYQLFGNHDYKLTYDVVWTEELFDPIIGATSVFSVVGIDEEEWYRSNEPVRLSVLFMSQKNGLNTSVRYKASIRVIASYSDDNGVTKQDVLEIPIEVTQVTVSPSTDVIVSMGIGSAKPGESAYPTMSIAGDLPSELTHVDVTVQYDESFLVPEGEYTEGEIVDGLRTTTHRFSLPANDDHVGVIPFTVAIGAEPVVKIKVLGVRYYENDNEHTDISATLRDGAVLVEGSDNEVMPDDPIVTTSVISSGSDFEVQSAILPEKVTFYDMNGSVVAEERPLRSDDKLKIRVSTSSLPRGLLFMHMTNGATVTVKPLLVL
jgi:hypothetical protein